MILATLPLDDISGLLVARGKRSVLREENDSYSRCPLSVFALDLSWCL